MALVANVNRDPKKRRTFRPEDFNPYASRDRSAELARRKRPKAALTVLRDIWCRRA